jgi:hypothetical protein
MKVPMFTTSKDIDITAGAKAGAAVISIAVVLSALSASAQTAKDVKGATPLVAIQNEAPAKLIVDEPFPEQLALGRVFIQYRAENLRILPVFGKVHWKSRRAWATRTISWMINPGPRSIPAEKRWSSWDWHPALTKCASN